MSEMSLLGFADKMNALMPEIIKEFSRRQANELYAGKITLPQFLLLNFLSRQGEAKMTTLANFMRVTTAAMTGIVDRLLRDGYVLRGYDKEDRRVIRIKLTAKGMELVKRINQQRSKMIINIFGRISQKERQDYLKILMRIQEILTQEKEDQ